MRFYAPAEHSDFGDNLDLPKGTLKALLLAHNITTTQKQDKEELRTMVEALYAQRLINQGLFPTEYLDRNFHPSSYSKSEVRMVLTAHSIAYEHAATVDKLHKTWRNNIDQMRMNPPVQPVRQAGPIQIGPDPMEGLTNSFNNVGVGDGNVSYGRTRQQTRLNAVRFAAQQFAQPNIPSSTGSAPTFGVPSMPFNAVPNFQVPQNIQAFSNYTQPQAQPPVWSNATNQGQQSNFQGIQAPFQQYNNNNNSNNNGSMGVPQHGQPPLASSFQHDPQAQAYANAQAHAQEQARQQQESQQRADHLAQQQADQQAQQRQEAQHQADQQARQRQDAQHQADQQAQQQANAGAMHAQQPVQFQPPAQQVLCHLLENLTGTAIADLSSGQPGALDQLLIALQQVKQEQDQSL